MIINKVKHNFLYEREGLYFGHRSQFIVGEDGGGVLCISVDNDLDETETIRVEKDEYLKYQRSNISK